MKNPTRPGATRASRATRPAVDEKTWNFSAVDECELVASCIWEYARESKAMSEAVKTAKRAIASQGKPAPETPARQAFREAANRAFGLLHQTGFPLEFWTGLPFPKPWQRIGEDQRKKWADKCPDKFADAVKFPAFQVTGDLLISGCLHGSAREAHNARTAIYQRLSQIDSGAANLDEAAKLRAKLAENSPLTIQGEGGVDSFIMQINWAQFSKKEIKACFNKWVDDYDCPLAKPSERGRGNTAADWWARIERLGLLRLRRVQTAGQVIQTIAKTLPVNQRVSEKFNTPGILNSEAVKAGKDFSFLFPFLAPEVLDCSLIN